MHRRYQLRPVAQSPHRAALSLILGETGLVGVVIVLVAAGIGVLVDFLVVNLHPFLSVTLPLGSVPLSLYWTARRALMSTNRTPNPDYIRNMALASVAGQAGCMSVIIIFAALFAGMYLDAQLDTHPVFTIGLVIVSIPFSLYAMIRLMLSSVQAIKHAPPQETVSRPGSETAFDDVAEHSLTKENGA